MSAGWLSLIFLVVLLALIPLGVKWLQRRMVGGAMAGSSMVSKVVSAVAVGPHQNVVTVEVGPPGDRIRLVLGVTAQSITCLHQSNVPAPASDGLPASANVTTGASLV